ncbi:MAG: hypothetical protein JWR26_3312 [Pedosphaera sp.]|nr:hypothetical protein [Pedosphaera sp.]
MRCTRHLILAVLLALSAQSASAFALLGPFAPWMSRVPGYERTFFELKHVNIGGPMDIGEGYRWNIPVITYGYDQSFLDFFGTNGVAAVEGAIQMLNDLPPASSIDLSAYPLETEWMNYRANAQGLMDLKSTALTLLLEQMGLTAPVPFVYCLSSNFNAGDAYHDLIRRNFDPFDTMPSDWVNDTIFYCYGRYGSDMRVADMWLSRFGGVDIYTFDPYTPSHPAVADNLDGFDYLDYTFRTGIFYIGLTMDDVGGLRYLLNATNIAMESLIPGVMGSGTNANNFVNRALRPGVEKITFQRLTYDSDNAIFVPTTNQYVDSYITNGSVQSQTLQRVVTKPDILFTVQDVDYFYVSRTGTTNWVNNGQPLHDGPGVIQPPIVITFSRLGPSLVNLDSVYPVPNPSTSATSVWGSYDRTTNSPIAYPVSQTTTNYTTFHLWLFSDYDKFFGDKSWNLYGPPNALFSLQTSTNLSDWLPITTITNIGGRFTYQDHVMSSTHSRFFRTVPQ